MINNPNLYTKDYTQSTPPPGNKVEYIDIDGSVLKTEYVTTGSDSTPPSNPKRDKLTFLEWNKPTTNITLDTQIGATYTTVDNKTWFEIEINPVTTYSITLYLNKTNTNTMTIDWGDGTTTDDANTGNVSISHNYSNYGTYWIGISVNNSGFFANPQYYLAQDITNKLIGGNAIRSITKLYLSSDSQVIDGNFGHMYALNEVSLDKNTELIISLLYSCVGLLSIIIPNNKTSIAANFCKDCNGLKQIVLSPSVTSIAGQGFDLSYINNILVSNNSVKLLDLRYVTTLGTFAFRGCAGAEKVYLNDNLTVLPQGIFQGLLFLESLTLPANLTQIGSNSLGDIYSIKTLSFPATFTTIDANALTSDQNGNSTKDLDTIYFYSTTPPSFGTNGLGTVISKRIKIYVPTASLTVYKTATGWSTLANWIYDGGY